jgi:hypothetical protein
VDTSKKIFVATGILVFDFEFFIGGRCQKKSWQLFEAASSFNILDVLFHSEVAYCTRAAIFYGLTARL